MLFWSIIGAVIITFFFVSIFLAEYTPLPLEDMGAMFFGPLFCGIMIGIILKNFELQHLIASTILMSFLSLMFIFLVYVFPQFLGVDIMPIFFMLEAPKLMALSSIFIFPLSIIGMIFGKALGDTIFLSEEEKIKQRELRDDTRKWHERLTKKRKL